MKREKPLGISRQVEEHLVEISMKASPMILADSNQCHGHLHEHHGHPHEHRSHYIIIMTLPQAEDGPLKARV